MHCPILFAHVFVLLVAHPSIYKIADNDFEYRTKEIPGRFTKDILERQTAAATVHALVGLGWNGMLLLLLLLMIF